MVIYMKELLILLALIGIVSFEYQSGLTQEVEIEYIQVECTDYKDMPCR